MRSIPIGINVIGFSDVVKGLVDAYPVLGPVDNGPTMELECNSHERIDAVGLQIYVDGNKRHVGDGSVRIPPESRATRNLGGNGFIGGITRVDEMCRVGIDPR